MINLGSAVAGFLIEISVFVFFLMFERISPCVFGLRVL
jgi:hypothetical protein